MNGRQAKKLRKQVYGNKAIVVKTTKIGGQIISDSDRTKYQSFKKDYYRTEDKKPLAKNVRKSIR